MATSSARTIAGFHLGISSWGEAHGSRPRQGEGRLNILGGGSLGIWVSLGMGGGGGRGGS